MNDPRPDDITRLVESARAGNAEAARDLFHCVYDELREVARRQRFVGRSGETMQATAVVNDLYLVWERRFPAFLSGPIEDRAAFFRAVGMAMRTILRDAWRSKRASKRGGGVRPGALSDDIGGVEAGGGPDRAEFLALDEALDRLEQANPRWAQVVMYRHFAGRSIEETARLMGVAESTVSADWSIARAWLRRELGGASING